MGESAIYRAKLAALDGTAEIMTHDEHELMICLLGVLSGDDLHAFDFVARADSFANAELLRQAREIYQGYARKID